MVQIKIRLDNDDHYVGGNTKEYIVIHDTGNYNDTADANANYFCTGTRDASAHYFVDANTIVQIVKDDDGSFHCGDGNGRYGITNRNSIGIEMCKTNGGISEATIINTIALIQSLKSKYNVPIDKIVRHYDASRKTCPYSMSANNWAAWYSFKSRIVSQVNPKPSTSKVVYRVRKSWDDVRSQIHAFENLQSAKDSCIPGYSVFNEVGNIVYSPGGNIPAPVTNSENGKFVRLKAHVTKWNVYPTYAEPIVGNQVGSLSPSSFGGIEYKILANPLKDVYTIETQAFGKVNIYIPVDIDSEFYSLGSSNNSSVNASSTKYLNLKPIPSWRVYPLGASCVVGSEVGKLAPATYGGLSYEILEDKGDIKIIQTGAFGKVQIYAPNNDSDCSITNTPIY